MLFAELMRRLRPDLTNNEIIKNFFVEKQSSLLCLHKIIEQGKLKYTGRAGEFWSSLTPLLCLSDLLMTEQWASNDLCTLVFHNNLITFEEFENSSGGAEDFILLEGGPNSKMVEQFPKAKLALFVGMLGNSDIEPTNLQCLKLLFKLKSFLGMTGGADTRGYYIVGINESDFIYLDPHLTQNYNSKSEPDYNSYKTDPSKMKVLHYSYFNPCVCIAFLIRNRKEFEELKTVFHRLQNNIKGNFYFEDKSSPTTNQNYCLDEQFSINQMQSFVDFNVPAMRKDSFDAGVVTNGH